MAYNIAQNAIQLPADRASGMLKTCMLIPPSCFHPADRQPAEQSLYYKIQRKYIIKLHCILEWAVSMNFILDFSLIWQRMPLENSEVEKKILSFNF